MPHSIEIRAIGIAAALRLVHGVLDHAATKGWRVAVAILDPAGQPLASARMDGTAPLIAENALDKAWTALMLRRTTKAFGERAAADPAFAFGAASRARLLSWEGGLPIVEDGHVIGGIGVSGAAGHEDAECAAVALAALGLAGSP
jgi:glc operon protein GlcG